MCIGKIEIQNIKSINNYKIKFDSDKAHGWHVIIGDNGAGKSTLAKAIALGLIGADEAKGLREEWNKWLRLKCRKGSIRLSLINAPYPRGLFESGIELNRLNSTVEITDISGGEQIFDEHGALHDVNKKIFSASYGPFRRFSGGSKEYDKLQTSHPMLGPHLSLFGEDVALTESLDWLKELRFKQLEKRSEGKILPLLIKFINEGNLLPGGTTFDEVSSDGVVFQDANGCKLLLTDLSDGYRSILSLTLDLIRQMVRFFGYKKVFERIGKGEMFIAVPGVVIIDEIDTHLHPSWQKRIGYWFTEYFPKIQFIVTTHSPIVCHAAENGSVYRLATPGSDQRNAPVEGVELKRLLYGNIVEALDTELFGKNVSRSDSSVRKLERMAELNLLSMEGEISEAEERELQELRTIMPTKVNVLKRRKGEWFS